MNRLLKFIPLGLFVSYAIKLGVVGASYQDAPILLILAIISIIYEIKPSHEVFQEQNKVIEKLENDIKKLQTQNDNFQTHLASIKLGTTIRTTNVR